jgi:hypothetical protein
MTLNVLGRSPQRNARFGSKADICSANGHVCFTPESDIKRDVIARTHTRAA